LWPWRTRVRVPPLTLYKCTGPAPLSCNSHISPSSRPISCHCDIYFGLPALLMPSSLLSPSFPRLLSIISVFIGHYIIISHVTVIPFLSTTAFYRHTRFSFCHSRAGGNPVNKPLSLRAKRSNLRESRGNPLWWGTGGVPQLPFYPRGAPI
jgi:hypothetical protein